MPDRVYSSRSSNLLLIRKEMKGKDGRLRDYRSERDSGVSMLSQCTRGVHLKKR